MKTSQTYLEQLATSNRDSQLTNQGMGAGDLVSRTFVISNGVAY